MNPPYLEPDKEMECLRFWRPQWERPQW